MFKFNAMLIAAHNLFNDIKAIKIGTPIAVL